MTLQQLYEGHQGKVSDKWSLYLVEYERLFSNLRNRPIHLLEIGIQNGGSLEIWSQYFPLAKKLVGCDINPDCLLLSYDDPRIAVVVSDANLDKTEEIILGHASSYDLIIDDGSHRSSDIIKSFARYFPHLEDDGLFVVEDLHCSYWQEFEGGLFDPYSSIAFFKALADIANYEHWGLGKQRKKLFEGFAEKYGVYFDEEVLAHIHSIEFINSVCVIRKAAPADNRLGSRIVSGHQKLVASEPKELVALGAEWRPPDQTSNTWASAPIRLDEELVRQLKEAERQNSALEQALIERDKEAVAERNSLLRERDDALLMLEKVLCSKSWKVTAPLRWLIHQIRRT